jgi:DeoR/GlpR family transcriptional regulator of sugar metabolism
MHHETIGGLVLTERQQRLFVYIQESGTASTREIIAHLRISRATAIREVDVLVAKGILAREGL